MVIDGAIVGTPLARVQAAARRQRKLRQEINNPTEIAWPTLDEYLNRERGKYYKPHTERELLFVKGELKGRFILLKGGEGGGKSVAGIIRDLEVLKYGGDGILVAPNYPHFKRSLWPEFSRWCPWDCVVPSERYRAAFDWEPQGFFILHFTTGARLYCGGIGEKPGGWEGPNVTFAHFDEARHVRTAKAVKVLDGRIRIAIPEHNIIPQLWLTTTPEMHWLFDYFGPKLCRCDNCKREFRLESNGSRQ